MKDEREIYLERIDIDTKVVVYCKLNGDMKDFDITPHVDSETIQKLNYGAKKTAFIKIKDMSSWCYDNYMSVPSGMLPELAGIEEKFFKNIKLN